MIAVCVSWIWKNLSDITAWEPAGRGPSKSEDQ